MDSLGVQGHSGALYCTAPQGNRARSDVQQRHNVAVCGSTWNWEMAAEHLGNCRIRIRARIGRIVVLSREVAHVFVVLTSWCNMCCMLAQ